MLIKLLKLFFGMFCFNYFFRIQIFCCVLRVSNKRSLVRLLRHLCRSWTKFFVTTTTTRRHLEFSEHHCYWAWMPLTWSNFVHFQYRSSFDPLLDYVATNLSNWFVSVVVYSNVWNYLGETFRLPCLKGPRPVVLIGRRYFCVVHRRCRKLWGYFDRRNWRCMVWWWSRFGWNLRRSWDRRCLGRVMMLWRLWHRMSC